MFQPMLMKDNPVPTAGERDDRWRRLLIGRFSWARVVRSTLIIYGILIAVALLCSDRIIFQPPAPSYAEGGRYYTVPTANGGHIGMYEPENLPPNGFLFLYIHGNAEDLGQVSTYLEGAAAHGFPTYAFDFRGYGISSASVPNTDKAIADGEAALRHLVRDRGIPLDRIIIHGRSVGAAIALHLATHFPVAGVVVESGFLSAFRARTQVALSPFDKLRNDRRIRELKCPVLFLHGTADRVIPAWQGRELFKLAHEPKTACWIEGAGHNDLFDTDPDTCWEAMSNFVAQVHDAQNVSVEPPAGEPETGAGTEEE